MTENVLLNYQNIMVQYSFLSVILKEESGGFSYNFKISTMNVKELHFKYIFKYISLYMSLLPFLWGSNPTLFLRLH